MCARQARPAPERQRPEYWQVVFVNAVEHDLADRPAARPCVVDEQLAGAELDAGRRVEGQHPMRGAGLQLDDFRAVLTDQDGLLTETATGNLCVVDGSTILRGARLAEEEAAQKAAAAK